MSVVSVSISSLTAVGCRIVTEALLELEGVVLRPATEMRLRSFGQGCDDVCGMRVDFALMKGWETGRTKQTN